MRKPSDLGFDDAEFILPPLTVREHLIESEFRPDGFLFEVAATTLPEQRAEQKATIQERCEKIAALVDHDQPAMVWCHLDKEADTLEQMIPGAVQISGKHRDEVKEERFSGFGNGDIRVLITKPKIGAWGLNFQHCNHVAYFPSHSFEQYYQAVRRCWRFGQTRPVTVDLVHTEGQSKVLENLQRKAGQAQAMFENLVAEMNHAISISADKGRANPVGVPSWL
jgi:superfamily II DNA/RNA helicase